MSVGQETLERMVAEAIRSIAHDGLENLSLRTVSAAAGCSTSVIFKHFGKKEGLISAALAQILKEERQFHDDLAAHTGNIQFHHHSFADLVASYVEMRSRLISARFCSEIVFKSKNLDEARAFVGLWQDMRKAFWVSRLQQSAADPALAGILVAFIVMEEVYAFSLNGHLEYRLLLAETCRALTAKAFGIAKDGLHSDISTVLGEGSPRFRVKERPCWNTLCESMLDAAAEEIVANCLTAINQRKIAKTVNVSSSMISYHFGSFDEFVNEAIWRAISRGIPREVNPAKPEVGRYQSIDQWSEVLSRFITPELPEISGAGFYINVARITGQVSLLVGRREELLPLVDHLRSYEGSGSYAASRSFWPQQMDLNRSMATAFGVWIKGQAILNEALGATQADSNRSMLQAAALLF